MYRIIIKPESDMELFNPRKDDSNLGVMVCWHKKYRLGDVQGYEQPELWLKRLNADRNTCTKLPLYLYDHSGITMSTSPFSDVWDSGQVGWIYCTWDRVREWFCHGSGKRLSKADLIYKARHCLQAEVDVYDQYLQGDIYFFELEKVEKCGACGHEIFTNVDSCGGYYGDDPLTNGMIDRWPEEVAVAYRSGDLLVERL